MRENGGVIVSENKETSERRRERLRGEELKRNSTGNMNDAFNRAEMGNLADLVGGLRLERDWNPSPCHHNRFYSRSTIMK